MQLRKEEKKTMLESLTDDEIESTIGSHSDLYSLEDIKDILTRINQDIIAEWDMMLDGIDTGANPKVYEGRDVVVLADGTGHHWDEQLKKLGLGDEHGILRDIILSLHTQAAKNHCSYGWGYSDPIVVRKPDEFRHGERHVLAEIARRTEELGSVARAVDTLATDVHGYRKSQWADQTGRNRSTVTRTTDN